MTKIVESLGAVGAPPRTPLGELTALLRPLAGGEGLVAPSLRTPSPAHRCLGPMKNPGHAPEGTGGRVPKTLEWMGCRQLMRT